ncbi:mechanosensitive ion channel [Shewanella sp. AS16]|uniref:mechanosensitive ion channel domain-containing protein n=1 Tax=Shewanella sp. AS16 TaxID=2907625 RepID=UPI001F213082|nr:mechanosensitive ion channel domain-containing protein [Shewanella sp. AS16]MCE9687037.1 mechanosensitive ion channel [Shewanella sp. AS16]
MLRIFLFIILFSSFASVASPVLSLNNRLGVQPQAEPQKPTTKEQLDELKLGIDSLANKATQYQQVQLNFERHKQALLTQLQQAAAQLPLDKEVELNQQVSMAHFRLSELKESEAQLSQQVAELLQRHNNLPGVISKARQALTQHQKTELAPIDTPKGQVQQAQRLLYEQSLATDEAELASSQKRIELAQLQLQLLRQQLLQQETQIETLNKVMSEKRQQQTEATLADNLQPSEAGADPLSQQLSDANQLYGQKLQTLTLQIGNAIEQQEDTEKQYQSQSQQLTNIQEQITWVKMNSAFGERFLQMLQSLPKPPSQEGLQADIADARLARYHLEQQHSINEQRYEQSNLLNEFQLKLLASQQVLIEQLLQGYDQYLNELAKLKVNFEQLNQLHQTLKNILNEHLFWVPNAASISKLWLTDVHSSGLWLLQPGQWQQLQQTWAEQNNYWSWWIILLVLCLVAQDLLSPRFNAAMDEYATRVGNVTQDKFIYTFKALTATFGYALVKPFPIIVAGLILYASERNSVQAVGMGTLAIGLIYLLHRLTRLLASEKGVMVGHFKWPREVLQLGQLRFRKFVLVASPLIWVMGFTEVLDASLVRNSIGRGAFILFCLVLFLLYKDMLLLSKQHNEPQQDGKNKQLLQKLLWSGLIFVPLVSAVLAIRGYYFTAFQMLLQLQLSFLLGLSFLLLYQLIRRWMLIEHRRIAFDRAKAKRAERLAQRDKGEIQGGINEAADSYEEPVVDLDTISSQSLGLVRSLLLLAFLISLIGLWTQTHTALFSFLDGISLWTSSAMVNGMEQTLPITLKSLLFAIVIVGFSMMIATNLPGLLELVLLQRLDLSPGTGFAITTVSRYLVVFFGLLVGFSTLGMEWSKLQWLIAALSVGLGFGLQEIFANFISGLIILFEKPVRIGDTVTIRELTGTVSKIQIRATTIIDWDRKEIIVPNKAFITEQLINWSLSDPITRVIVYVSVARDSDPAKVEASLYQAVRECQDALQTPEPEVWFAGFGKHTQDYEVRAYAKEMASRWPLRHDLHKRITRKLKENQLELAYPQMEIHIHNGQQRDTASLIRS